MATIGINGEKYELKDWNQLNKNELIRLAFLATQKMSIYQLCISFFLMMTGFRLAGKKPVQRGNEICYMVKKGKKQLLISEVGFTSIVEAIRSHFFVSSKPGEYTINPKLHVNTFNKFKLGGTWYQSPKNALSNLIFEEYIYTETYFYRYNKTKDEKWLNLLISVLYKPKIINANTNFDIAVCKANALKIAKIDEAYKLLVLWYYIGSKNFLAGKFRFLFNGGVDDGLDPFESFLKLTSQLAGKPHENEKVRQTKLYDVLANLNGLAETAYNKKYGIRS